VFERPTAFGGRPLFFFIYRGSPGLGLGSGFGMGLKKTFHGDQHVHIYAHLHA
jgi:hypothetical protein